MAGERLVPGELPPSASGRGSSEWSHPQHATVARVISIGIPRMVLHGTSDVDR